MTSSRCIGTASTPNRSSSGAVIVGGNGSSRWQRVVEVLLGDDRNQPAANASIEIRLTGPLLSLEGRGERGGDGGRGKG